MHCELPKQQIDYFLLVNYFLSPIWFNFLVSSLLFPKTYLCHEFLFLVGDTSDNTNKCRTIPDKVWHIVPHTYIGMMSINPQKCVIITSYLNCVLYRDHCQHEPKYHLVAWVVTAPTYWETTPWLKASKHLSVNVLTGHYYFCHRP